MEGSLRKVIAGDQLILNCLPPIPELKYFLINNMLSIFQSAIKFEYQVLAIL